jgi:Cu(I)/Ag(I) efflux system membrane fusion protein
MFVNGIVESEKAEKSNELLIPKSAVLWTGKRSVVYVKVPNTANPTFSFREIELGPETGNYYVVANSLNEGEEVAVNGVFKIDAAAQLQNRPSMMNPKQTDGSGFTPDASHNTNKQKEHAMFKVSGNCDICKDRIETAAQSVDGVLSASWDPGSQMLHLNFNPTKTTADDVQKAIAAVGHDTEKYKAPDSVYNKLPECCQYR